VASFVQYYDKNMSQDMLLQQFSIRSLQVKWFLLSRIQLFFLGF